MAYITLVEPHKNINDTTNFLTNGNYFSFFYQIDLYLGMCACIMRRMQ